MRKLIGLLFITFAVIANAGEPVEGSFPTIKMKTFGDEKFVFPSGMQGAQLNIVFLGMSETQDNGQLQQEQLLEWQVALEERGVFSPAVMGYHFPAMSSPPFFVKGIIANAMAESYEGKVPLNQSGVMYLDDLAEFAEESGLVLDEQPTIVIADSNGKPLQMFKGAVTPEGVDEVVAAIEALVQS